MKVELLVNLKIASGKIIPSGTVFSDEHGPIPEFVLRRVPRRMARIIDVRVTIPTKEGLIDGSKKAEREEGREEVSGSEEKEITDVLPKAVKKLLKGEKKVRFSLAKKDEEPSLEE